MRITLKFGIVLLGLIISQISCGQSSSDYAKNQYRQAKDTYTKTYDQYLVALEDAEKDAFPLLSSEDLEAYKVFRQKVFDQNDKIDALIADCNKIDNHLEISDKSVDVIIKSGKLQILKDGASNLVSTFESSPNLYHNSSKSASELLNTINNDHYQYGTYILSSEVLALMNLKCMNITSLRIIAMYLTKKHLVKTN